MRIVVQNLQKRKHLGSDLWKEYKPDIFLAQEIALRSEDAALFADAHFVSGALKCGTAIQCRHAAARAVRRVKAPVAEFGAFVRKKTTVANYDGIEVITFHGYNGKILRFVREIFFENFFCA